MSYTTHTDDVVARLGEGHDLAEAPGGAYARIMVGRKSAAWLIRLKKDGGVRLILRTTDTPPKALSEGAMIEKKTGHTQFRIGTGDLKRGRALIAWAVKAVTPTDEPVLAAAKQADKPVTRKAAAKPKLQVIKEDGAK